MVAYYTILGRQVGSQYVRQSVLPLPPPPRSVGATEADVMMYGQLAMATLGSLAAGITYSISGSKASKAQGPPIQASNSAEEAFIKCVSQIALMYIEHLADIDR